jgi:hypothetical protein
MTKRRPITKRTKQEIANSIITEGTMTHHSSLGNTEFKYYKAFGQRWRLTYSLTGFLMSIEQVDENGKRISF